MNQDKTATLIMQSVLDNLASRKGLDIKELVDDEDIYEEIRDDLFSLIYNILYKYERGTGNVV